MSLLRRISRTAVCRCFRDFVVGFIPTIQGKDGGDEPHPTKSIPQLYGATVDRQSVCTDQGFNQFLIAIAKSLKAEREAAALIVSVIALFISLGWWVLLVELASVAGAMGGMGGGMGR